MKKDLLSVMQSRLGIQEIPGANNSSTIIDWFKAIGHAEVTDDETSWCATCVGSALKECDLPIPARDVCMMARSYLSYGVACKPAPGAIAIWPRGTGWQGHVNVVESVAADGMVICIGGNQGGLAGGDAVTRTKPMDPAKALGFRMPVAATVPALRKAGSTEIKHGDRVQNLGTAAVAIGPVIAAVKDILEPVTQVPKMGSPAEALGYWQHTMEAANAVAKVVLQNPWLAGMVFLGLGAAWVGHQLKANRVAKAASGVPLSAQVGSA
jgi:uncharacterized protein (TIGR02594 family)